MVFKFSIRKNVIRKKKNEFRKNDNQKNDPVPSPSMVDQGKTIKRSLKFQDVF